MTPRSVTPLSNIVSRLEGLRAHVTDSGNTDSELARQLDEVHALAAGLEPYLEAHTSPPSSALTALAEATAAEDWPAHFTAGDTRVALEQEMLSGHVEGQFLSMLVRATGAQRILEIGVFTGYSALAMAEALPDDGHLIGCEIDAFAADFARHQFRESQAGGKIDIRVGPALETLAELADESAQFDLIFIDADKGGYQSYLERILERSLLAPNGVICVDNTLMHGWPWMPGATSANGEAIAQFNSAVSAEPELEQVLLPLRDGVTLIRQR